MAILFISEMWIFWFDVWNPLKCLDVCDIIEFSHSSRSDGAYLGNGSTWFWSLKWSLAISIKRTYISQSILFLTELPSGMNCSSSVEIGKEYDLSYFITVICWFSRSLMCIRDGVDIRIELPPINSSDEVEVFFESTYSAF